MKDEFRVVYKALYVKQEDYEEHKAKNFDEPVRLPIIMTINEQLFTIIWMKKYLKLQKKMT